MFLLRLTGLLAHAGATLGAPILMVEDADSMDGDDANIHPDMASYCAYDER